MWPRFSDETGRCQFLPCPKSSTGIIPRLYTLKILNSGFAESFQRRFQCSTYKVISGVSFGSSVIVCACICVQSLWHELQRAIQCVQAFCFASPNCSVPTGLQHVVQLTLSAARHQETLSSQDLHALKTPTAIPNNLHGTPKSDPFSFGIVSPDTCLCTSLHFPNVPPAICQTIRLWWFFL